MPETAENVAAEFGIEREAQDRMALRSQVNALRAQRKGFSRGDHAGHDRAEEGRTGRGRAGRAPAGDLARSAREAQGVVQPDGTVTAGNASGINDGACALLLANERTATQYGLTPRARVVAMATAGVAPRIMGSVPSPRPQGTRTGRAERAADRRHRAQRGIRGAGSAVLRRLGLADDDPRVNPNGGAIALGHPLGASGARLVTTAVNQLQRTGARFALCTMCIGVGQGIALVWSGSERIKTARGR